nr:EOG090X0154 [Eulimnadia texana]
MSGEKVPVSPRVYGALQNVDFEELARCTETEIRPVLPCLSRMSLINSLDQSKGCADARKIVFRILSGMELVNSIVALLSTDFHSLEIDVKKEQQLRQKLGNQTEDSFLIQSLSQGLALEFERSDATRRLRLLLSELLTIMSQAKEARNETGYRSSELFDHAIYLDEVSDVLCVVLAELPVLLPITEVAEALLRVQQGPVLIARIVANMPDTLNEVCHALISNGEKFEEETVMGRARLECLRTLCRMCPDQALPVRAKCVEVCKMPALVVFLSLDHALSNAPTNDSLGDVVPFVSGLLLGSDTAVRSWFSLFVRNGQKRHEPTTALQTLRETLLKKLRSLVWMAVDKALPDAAAMEASSLLRLYCALKGIAGMKFYDEEGISLLQLITCRPPPTEAGLRFVALGLCMLIACPSLIGSPDQEQRGMQWVKWLVREEAYFESTVAESGSAKARSSFGELLLLMAIHFHSGQLSAVCDLVCSTLGMRLPIRPHSMARMKQAFTQDVFTEQVVTSHAVRVPVTPDLNADMAGFLPVHCIYQLLKSRSFTKHRVHIKTWIYRQICNSTAPLHPVLPSLIEVYVNSVLNPIKGQGLELRNEPISDEEIKAVFAGSFIGNGNKKEGEVSIAAQLLLLYYVLLYEDTRLGQVKNFMLAGIAVKSYPQEFFADLPIRYLIRQAEKAQHLYAGIFPQLLKLLASHFPQLCLVEDWMYDDSQLANGLVCSLPWTPKSCTPAALNRAFETIASNPAPAMLFMRQLLTLNPKELWSLASVFIKKFRTVLNTGVPRQAQDLYRQVWLRLNSILPRRLWVMTVNALRADVDESAPLTYTQDHLIFDPLQVLRCDPRVFRHVKPIETLVYMLKAWLAASRAHLSRHLMDKPLLVPPTPQGPAHVGSGITSDSEREELKTALIATQESAVVQIVLEMCLRTDQDDTRKLSDLREIQSIVCSFLHQVFIADPNLAKLVHFQGYSASLLPVTVKGVPSMHICLDFIPELLAQPDLEKQIFAIDLISHLSLQYALPKSFSIARLAVNVLSTLLNVFSMSGKTELLLSVLPALVRIATAFPPLVEDVIVFLVQLGKISYSQNCLNGASDYHIVNAALRDQTPAQRPEVKEETTEFFVKEEKMEVEPSEKETQDELEEGELPDVSSQVEKMFPKKHLFRKRINLANLEDSLSLDDFSPALLDMEKVRSLLSHFHEGSVLGAAIYRTFEELCNSSLLQTKLY